MKAIDLSFEAAIRFAADLIRIQSPPGAEGDAANRVRKELERLGFDDVWIDHAGNVVGRISGKGSAPPVMLSCHLDVVDIGDASSWEHPPFSGEIHGGYLHGRGAMDIKGQLALQTYAAASFLGDRLEGDVIVAHTVLEERGGWGMEHLMHSGALNPAAVIIGEATNGDICIGHRGRAELIVEMRGVAGHASAPERAKNPLNLMPDVITALREFADGLPSDSVVGRSTLAPTQVETLPSSRNVIPDRARIVVDWRVLPDWTPARTVETLRMFLRERVRVPEGFDIEVYYAEEHQHTYTGLEEVRQLFSPGFLLAADHPVVKAAAEAVQASTGKVPRVRPWTFATDGGHTCGRHSIPTIGFAPGEERYAHTNRERLELASARVAYEAYPELVRAVQSAVRDHSVKPKLDQ